MAESKGDIRVPIYVPTNLDKSIGQTFKAWREFRGLTLPEFMQKILPPPPYLSYLYNLENGKIRFPNDAHLAKLSRGLSIPPAYLLLRLGPDQTQFIGRDKDDEKNSDVHSLDKAVPTPPISRTVIETLITSTARIRVLELFFAQNTDEIHVREIVRRTGLEINAARRELERLTEGGILNSRWEQNRRIYSVIDNPLVTSLLSRLFGIFDKASVPDLQTDQNISIGECFKQWRKFRGLSQSRAAELTKRSPGYLSLLESGGIKKPNDNILSALAAGLDISEDVLTAKQTPEDLGLTK